MKKRSLRIASGVLLTFLLLNLAWFLWRQAAYGDFTKGMTAEEESGFLVPRYVYKDDDGYDYSVKFPDYLHTTGNLAVSLPWTDVESPWTDGLIVWPEVGGGFTYGVILYEVTGEEALTEYQIYIDSGGNALDGGDAEIVERHRENVDDLLERAERRWPGVLAGTK